MALPVAVGQLGHIMMGVVDSIMVGKVSTTALAASALVSGLYAIGLVAAIGMSFGLSTLTAIANGERRPGRSGLILNNALILYTAFSLILFLILYTGADIVFFLNQPPAVAVQAFTYMKIVSFSIIPLMLFQTYRQFLEGHSDVITPMIIAISMNLFNGFFNWIFIFGKFGMDPLYLDGAGYATLLSRILMFISIAFFTYKGKFGKYIPAFKFRLSRRIVSSLLKIGIPSSLSLFVEVAAFSLAGIMVGWFGEASLASHHIALNLASVTYMTVVGFSVAGNIRTGNYFGERNLGKIKETAASVIISASALMLFTAVIFITFRNQLPQIFSASPDVVSLSATLLVTAGFFQIFDGLQAVTSGVLRGLTDVRIPMLIIIFSYWIIALPAGAFFAFTLELKTPGIWLGLLLGLVFTASALLLRLRNRITKLKKIWFEVS